MMAKAGKHEPPIVRFVKREPYLYTYLGVRVLPGLLVSFVSRVDLRLIEQQLRDGVSGDADSVEGIFGSIFKGISKAVSTVGKVTGLGKVIGAATKIIKNPIFKMLPIPITQGLSFAASAVDVARDVATSVAAKKQGNPAAGKALALAAAKAEKYGLDMRRDVMPTARKIYKVMILE